MCINKYDTFDHFKMILKIILKYIIFNLIFPMALYFKFYNESKLIYTKKQ